MESPVVSSSHLPLDSHIEPPLIIFTVLGPPRADGTQQNSFSAAIIAELQQFKERRYENPEQKSLEQLFAESTCRAVVLHEGTPVEGIDFSRAIALFDDREHKGLFSLRHTRRFRASSYPKASAWVKDAKWTVVIHRNKPERVARQIAGMFVNKFDTLVKEGHLPQAPRPLKKRKPRKARVRGAARSQYFMS